MPLGCDFKCCCLTAQTGHRGSKCPPGVSLPSKVEGPADPRDKKAPDGAGEPAEAAEEERGCNNNYSKTRAGEQVHRGKAQKLRLGSVGRLCQDIRDPEQRPVASQGIRKLRLHPENHGFACFRTRQQKLPAHDKQLVRGHPAREELPQVTFFFYLNYYTNNI